MDLPTSRTAPKFESEKFLNAMQRFELARDQLAGILSRSPTSPAQADALIVPTFQSRVSLVPATNEDKHETDELARARADIEHATAILRGAEPALEVGYQRSAPLVQRAQSHRTWIVISLLWISAVLATGGAIFTIASLVN